MWDEEDIWENGEVDGDLRNVLSAWKAHKKTRGGGILEHKVVTVPKGACHDGQVFRLKPEPEEQHPQQDTINYGVEQQDPLANIWATEDIEDVVDNQKSTAANREGVDEWYKRYQERVQSRRSMPNDDGYTK